MKAGIRMLESSSTPCFVHKLQSIIKDSLFSENNISVLIAKASQNVVNLNHSSTACENLKNIKGTLGSLDSIQKALLLVQDVKTRLNSTYLINKKTRKI